MVQTPAKSQRGLRTHTQNECTLSWYPIEDDFLQFQSAKNRRCSANPTAIQHARPTRSDMLLTTGATAFDYLASLTVQDAATVAKPALPRRPTQRRRLESLPAPKGRHHQRGRRRRAVLVPRTDPFSNPKAEARQEASTTWDAARRAAQDDGPKADYAARAREWVLNDGVYAAAKSALMADDFVFFGPVIGPLNKQDYLGTVSGFKISAAFPDLELKVSDFTRDPTEEDRYWGIVRLEGTHTEALDLGTGAPPIKATGNAIDVGPQAVSVTFDADGRVSRYTGGYVVDRRQGKTGMLGAVFAIVKRRGAGSSRGRRVAKILNSIGALRKNFPKARSARRTYAKWRSWGRGFGKRTAGRALSLIGGRARAGYVRGEGRPRKGARAC